MRENIKLPWKGPFDGILIAIRQKKIITFISIKLINYAKDTKSEFCYGQE